MVDHQGHRSQGIACCSQRAHTWASRFLLPLLLGHVASPICRATGSSRLAGCGFNGTANLPIHHLADHQLVKKVLAWCNSMQGGSGQSSYEVERVISFGKDPEPERIDDGTVKAHGLGLLHDGQRRLGLQGASSSTLLPDNETSWAAYQHEAKRLAELAVPIAGSHLCNLALSLISLAFIGRLGEFELSVAVLANSCYNVTGFSVLIGFLGAQETLAGQAYGAKRYRSVGILLQRAVLITLLMGACICGVWSQAKWLLLAAGQEATIAAGAARFLQLCMPALLIAGAFESVKRYLMVQGVVKPSTLAASIATALSPLYNWLLIFKLGWGLDGAILAMTAANLTMLVGLSVWTLRHDKDVAGTPQQTWHGWSREALKGWSSYLRLALPSTAMVCIEWWAAEFCILMSGWLDNPKLHVAVMGVCASIQAALYMLPQGLSSATTVRISNLLGAKLLHSARRTMYTAGSVVLGMQLALAAIVFASRRQLGYIFTDVEEVANMAARLLPILALAFPGDGLNCVLGGVLRGAGQQGLGAAINFVTYWCLGLPMVWFLAFKQGLGITGIWIGLAATTTLQATAMTIIVLQLN